MSLFTSALLFNKITDIKKEDLDNNGIKALFLDVDNTLTLHHSGILYDGVLEWIRNMESKGVTLIILSNSKRFRIEPLANSIGLKFVSLGLKPLFVGYRKALKLAGFKKKECAIVGDQIFTDILGANCYGIKSILTRPYILEEKTSFKIRRYFEKKILKDNF